MQMSCGMEGAGRAVETPLQRMEQTESTLADRLESIRKLKAALAPLYQSLNEAQKQMADRLLVPPMMGFM